LNAADVKFSQLYKRQFDDNNPPIRFACVTQYHARLMCEQKYTSMHFWASMWSLEVRKFIHLSNSQRDKSQNKWCTSLLTYTTYAKYLYSYDNTAIYWLHNFQPRTACL